MLFRSPKTFPKDEIAEITAKVFKENPVSVLQYSASEGYTPLRETLKKYMADNFDVKNDYDEILCVSGSQQAADLLSKALLNEGDTVICESPTFIGCMNTFRSYGANLVGVPMEDDGMNIELLEKALKENEKARFIYLIPTFQKPSGITTSLEKRHKILELAKKYDIVIMEDNPYGELRFKGEHIPPIKSLDTEGRVVYCGSFSKVMAPAFRVGFMCVHKDLFPRLVVGKQCTDVHTNMD